MGSKMWPSLSKCANFKEVLLFLYLNNSIINGFYNIFVCVVKMFSRCDVQKYFV